MGRRRAEDADRPFFTVSLHVSLDQAVENRLVVKARVIPGHGNQQQLECTQLFVFDLIIPLFEKASAGPRKRRENCSCLAVCRPGETSVNSISITTGAAAALGSAIFTRKIVFRCSEKIACVKSSSISSSPVRLFVVVASPILRQKQPFRQSSFQPAAIHSIRK